MGIEGWVSLVMLGLILSLLCALYLQCRKCWCLLMQWHATPLEGPPPPNRHAEENRELRSALRAQQAHVDQLLRKIELLQDLLPEA